MSQLVECDAVSRIALINPNISFRMQVTDPNGEYVKDVNGLLLCDVSPSSDYEIDLTLYGTYSAIGILKLQKSVSIQKQATRHVRCSFM